MNRFARASLVIVTGAGLSLTASPAWAHSDDPDDAGWVPAETVFPDFYTPLTIHACGTDVLIESGDEREVELRQTDLGDGVVRTEFRGDFTVDLTRQSDGAKIDELDISGDGYDEVGPDGGFILLNGPSIAFPMDDVQRQAIEDAAGTDLAYWKRGTVVIHFELDESGATVSESWDVDARIHDLCTWFDGNRGHGHHNHDKNWRHDSRTA
jgi:hypothetical protein